MNPKKSEVLVFNAKKGNLKPILGIPIKRNAKYLGVAYNTSLNIDFSVRQIKAKISYVFFKLLPVLKLGDFRTRFNLWQVFAKPLFRMILSIVGIPRSISGHKSLRVLQQAMRGSLKKFTLSIKQADNRIFDHLIDTFDYNVTAIFDELDEKILCQVLKIDGLDPFEVILE